MILKQMAYVSHISEVANIIFYLAVIFNFPLPSGYAVGLNIYNFIYVLYINAVILFQNKLCQIFALCMFILSICKEILWKDNPALCIADSLICLVLLFLIYKAGEEKETSQKNE